MSPLRRLPVVAVAVSLLALSACSGDTSDADRRATQPADAPTASPTADEAQAAVEGHDGHYAEPATSKALRAGDARTVLDIPVWDFDDQAAVPSSRCASRRSSR